MASAAGAGSGATAEPERGGFTDCRPTSVGKKFTTILRRCKSMNSEEEIIPAVFDSLSVCGEVRVYPHELWSKQGSTFPKENECGILLGPHSGTYVNVKDMLKGFSYPTYAVESFFYQARLHPRVSQYRAFSSREDAPFVLYHEIAKFLKNLLIYNTYDTFDITRIIQYLNEIITRAKENHIDTIRSDIGDGDEFNPSTYLRKICEDGNTLLSSIMKQLLVQEKITEIPLSRTDRVACLSPNRVCTIDLDGDGYRVPKKDKHSQSNDKKEVKYENIIFNILLKIKVVVGEHVCVIPLWFDREKFKRNYSRFYKGHKDPTIDIFSSELLEHLLTSDFFMRVTLPALLVSVQKHTSTLDSGIFSSIIESLTKNPYSVFSCDIGCKSIWGVVDGNSCILFDKSVNSQGYVNPDGQIAMTVYDDSSMAARHLVYHPGSSALLPSRSLVHIDSLLTPTDLPLMYSSTSPQPPDTPRSSLSPDPKLGVLPSNLVDPVGPVGPVDVEVEVPPRPLSSSGNDTCSSAIKRGRPHETHESGSENLLTGHILSTVIVPTNKPLSHLESLLQSLWDIKDSVANRLSWSGWRMATPPSGGRLRMARSLRKRPSFSKKKRGRSFGRMKTRSRSTRRTRRTRRRIHKN
jgi:hypothetical protein